MGTLTRSPRAAGADTVQVSYAAAALHARGAEMYVTLLIESRSVPSGRCYMPGWQPASVALVIKRAWHRQKLLTCWEVASGGGERMTITANGTADNGTWEIDVGVFDLYESGDDPLSPWLIGALALAVVACVAWCVYRRSKAPSVLPLAQTMPDAKVPA